VLTPLLAWVSLKLFGLSVPGLRVWPALAAWATVVVAGLTAREFGGGRRAQLLAPPPMGPAVATAAELQLTSPWRVRRPVIEEIATVSAVEPGAAVFPSVDTYDRLTNPMTIVLADDGLYTSRRDEVRAIVHAVPGRRLVEISSNYNVPMTRPADLAAVIVDLVSPSKIGHIARGRPRLSSPVSSTAISGEHR
jgi:hypothetical protein